MFRTIWNALFGRVEVEQPDLTLWLADTSSVDYDAMRDEGLKLLAGATGPRALASLNGTVRLTFSLYQRAYRGLTQSDDVKRRMAQELSALEHVDGLAQLFLFHGDGTLRQAALEQLQGPLLTRASLYGLIQRMNDWVPAIRAAAKEAADRCLPDTQPDVITPVLWMLLPHMSSWQRWSDEGPNMIKDLLMRQDVAEALLARILSDGPAKSGVIFRALSQNPWLDGQLEASFRTAPLPHIRTMALDALLSGHARWPTGRQTRTWIDRSMGHYRLDPEMAERPLTITPAPLPLLQLGVKDRASMVRKRAVDGLIALRDAPPISDHLEQLLAALRHDPNLGVQSRVTFLQRQLQLVSEGR